MTPIETTYLDQLRSSYDTWHGSQELASTPAHERNHRRFLAWALDHVGARAGASLLDVACGEGTCLALAEARGCITVGVDLSQVALGRARARVRAPRVSLADGERLPFPTGVIDGVTCLGSLEHFPSPLAGAREIARVLKPDGRALIFVPNLMFLGHLYFGLRHGVQPSEGGQHFSESFMTSGGWRDLLERAGLRVLAVHPWNEIWATDKVGPLVKRAWNAASRFVPLNGAYAFGFLCAREN